MVLYRQTFALKLCSTFVGFATFKNVKSVIYMSEEVM